MIVDGVAGIGGAIGLLLTEQYAYNPMPHKAELESFPARVVSCDPASTILALTTVEIRAKRRREVRVEGSMLCGR